MSIKVELISYTADPVMAIEHAAANCYDSTPVGDGKLLNGCMKSGHTAVAEFASFTFHVSGVSRSLLAQLTRHRHMSFCVRSQRYCREDETGYVIPPKIKNDPKWADRYREVVDQLFSFYGSMVDDGVAPEDARYVLPNACETELDVCINFRELMQFCNLRLCSRAQWEIRKMTEMMRDEVVRVMPEAKRFLVPNCEKNFPVCFCTESRSCGKHPKLNEIVYGNRTVVGQ